MAEIKIIRTMMVPSIPIGSFTTRRRFSKLSDLLSEAVSAVFCPDFAAIGYSSSLTRGSTKE